MIKRTGLTPWKFEFPFPGSLTSTFQGVGLRLLHKSPPWLWGSPHASIHRSLSHTLPLALSLPLSLSPSLPLSLTLSLYIYIYLTLTLSLTISLSVSHTHTVSLSHTHTLWQENIRLIDVSGLFRALSVNSAFWSTPNPKP